MKRSLYLLVFLSLCFTSAVQGEKNRRQGNQDRIPEVSAITAIQLTLDHHKELHPEMGEIFVDEALFIRTEDEVFWKIGVRLKKLETGHLHYKVTNDKKVESHSMVKDG